jgi:endonuclease-8
MLTCFENDWVIYSHNQLYGRWYICPSGELPDTARHLRLAIHNNHYSALLYSASDIEVMAVGELEQHPFLARLGPDILSDRPDAGHIVDRLRSRQFRNRQLAGLLLDQGFLAGLGNYLRAEVLHAAGLHPLRKPADCSDRQLQKLARNIIKLKDTQAGLPIRHL